MTFIAPLQPLQVWMSMLNTRLNRCARVIVVHCLVSVGGSFNTSDLFPLPRFTLVNSA